MSQVSLAVDVIKSICPETKPTVCVVLGSGLGGLIDDIQNKVTIPYSDLPGFPKPSVEGHEGNLILGDINDVSVACLQGRSHSYENNSHEPVITYVRTLQKLGCKYFIATNASGSLREDFAPGDLVLINDHINMQGSNPLTGPNDDDFGPRFPALDNAYDKDLQNLIAQKAAELDINLHEGIYISVLGPSYETAAEIRFFRLIGADVVGMSTVPEVVVANHCGMKVAVIATVTNYATGLTQVSHSHEAVVATANQAAHKLTHLVKSFVSELP